jgi:hypothetical protein
LYKGRETETIQVSRPGSIPVVPTMEVRAQREGRGSARPESQIRAKRQIREECQRSISEEQSRAERQIREAPTGRNGSHLFGQSSFCNRDRLQLDAGANR